LTINITTNINIFVLLLSTQFLAAQRDEEWHLQSQCLSFCHTCTSHLGNSKILRYISQFTPYDKRIWFIAIFSEINYLEEFNKERQPHSKVAIVQHRVTTLAVKSVVVLFHISQDIPTTKDVTEIPNQSSDN